MQPDTGTLRACLMLGPAVTVCLFLALWPLAHLLPPPSPLESPEFYASFYRGNVAGVRWGAVFLMLSAVCLCPFFAVMAAILGKIEGRAGPWTYTLLLATAVSSTTFFCAGVFFAVAAFRPERAIDELYLLNDLAWIMLVIPAFPAAFQGIAMGMATLSDRHSPPLLPRWSGFLNFWFALAFLPGFLVAMFKRGPFAWDGLLSFWVPAILFGVWFFVLVYAAWGAIERLQESPP